MQMRHLRSIKDTLTWDSLEKVIRAFISLHLGYCNALLSGLAAYTECDCQIVGVYKEI